MVPKGPRPPRNGRTQIKRPQDPAPNIGLIYSVPPAIIECYFIAGRCKITNPLCADLESICLPFVLQSDWALCPVHRKPSDSQAPDRPTNCPLLGEDPPAPPETPSSLPQPSQPSPLPPPTTTKHSGAGCCPRFSWELIPRAQKAQWAAK